MPEFTFQTLESAWSIQGYRTGNKRLSPVWVRWSKNSKPRIGREAELRCQLIIPVRSALATACVRLTVSSLRVARLR